MYIQNTWLKKWTGKLQTGKISGKHLSDKRLISKIHKDFLQLSKMNNPLKERDGGVDKTFYVKNIKGQQSLKSSQFQ